MTSSPSSSPNRPSTANDPDSGVVQVPGSAEAALRLGAGSAEPAPQPGVPQEQPTNPDGTPVVPPANPEDPALMEESEQEPPFEATCPTCEKRVQVYVPDPEPAPHNEHKIETAYCVACGRRWTRAELEAAGTLTTGDTEEGDPASADAAAGASDQADIATEGATEGDGASGRSRSRSGTRARSESSAPAAQSSSDKDKDTDKDLESTSAAPEQA